MTVSVMVFTRDPRVTDNPALTAAARAGAVIPCSSGTRGSWTCVAASPPDGFPGWQS
jgi:deoxyribodipyrimidine photolyase